MNKHVTNIKATTPPPIPKPMLFADRFHLPVDGLAKGEIIFETLEANVHRFLYSQEIPSISRNVERCLVVTGLPGTGKTMSSMAAVRRFGNAAALLDAALLSGEEEGAAPRVLEQFMTEAVQFSNQHQVPVAVFLDDFELGITSDISDKSVGRTVNSGLLIQRLQSLATSNEYQSFNGVRIPLIFTGNDFTGQRESLFRAGRAIFEKHVLTQDDVAQLVLHIFKPRGFGDRKFIERMVKTYHREPLSFWHNINNDLKRHRIDACIARGLSPIAADAELTRQRPIDPNQFTASAKARSGNQAQAWFRH